MNARRLLEAVSPFSACFLGLLSIPYLPCSAADVSGERVLAHVEVVDAPQTFALPAHAILQSTSGGDYLLVFADESALRQAGWPWQPLARGIAPEQCVIATEMRPGARNVARARFEPLLEEGATWVLPATDDEAVELAELGFALKRISPEPITWSKPAAELPHFSRAKLLQDPLVSEMLASVQTTNLYSLLARLSGVEQVLAGGLPRLISTRHSSSGLPLTSALEFASQRLLGLNLAPFYHYWTSTSGVRNRNLVANLPGTSRSNELVLVTAHIDDMPVGSTAPGADDNATGSAGVLTAAAICSQYQFERTLRFVLFTGEEQGMLGSAQYATAAKAAGDNIVGVLNLDMLGWDAIDGPVLSLHTRTPTNSGYSGDLAIFAVLTNVVSSYGLSSNLTPALRADGITASDHSPFWDRGYSALLAIEDYPDDFNPYYHTVADTLSRVNLRYFTAAVRACVGTAAHMAGPVARAPNDCLQVLSSDWNLASGLGGSQFLARHLPFASEGGPDPLDLAFSNAPASSTPRRLTLSSLVSGVELATDSRPLDSESTFLADLSLVAPEGILATAGNKLRFEFLNPPDPGRVYLARILLDSQFTPGGTDFLCVTNLRDLAAQSGYLQLPGLSYVSNAAVYGTCEIAERFVDQSRERCRLQLLSVTNSPLLFTTDAQVGTRIVDVLESSSTIDSVSWDTVLVCTNDITPDATSFDAGWKELGYSVEPATLPAAPKHFFRLKRTWLEPAAFGSH